MRVAATGVQGAIRGRGGWAVMGRRMSWMGHEVIGAPGCCCHGMHGGAGSCDASGRGKRCVMRAAKERKDASDVTDVMPTVAK